ncbi:uncharacterized protein LOC108331645 isoform X3 [Vigna angularis]|uniref:uncharacterized protein LOC108331645 isoform X3 n=1 Tax=Phaseolus angularis TaxID=3914 RepID=UPI0022B3AC90|nr:uncharacterized protein LOC108331645 isoform X3 [Vigna angularis]
MESLKAAIPESVKRAIGDSNVEDLQSTCTFLHRFFLHFDPFHQIIAQLADPKYGLCGKSKEDALKSKQLGNECFSNADYAKALDCYTQALRKAPLDVGDMKSNLVATLYINRATVLHRMSLLVECLRDCTHALQICPSYAKAWYRRSKANASLGNYRNAICDLNVAKILEPSMGGKRQIEGELKILLDQCKSTSAMVQIQHKENSCNTVGEMPQVKLQCISIPDKGRGMVSSCVISPGSLVHSEEPYAMIILKQCRQTHCHYCLNDLPADRVPCLSCSIPLYCSHQCQIRAGGQMFRMYPEKDDTFKKMPSDLGEYASEVIQSNDSEQEIEDITEHKHECRGVHWPVVLPSEIVLAGRILARFLLNSTSDSIINFVERLELSHCYKHMSSESKLDSHIYAIVLLYCLQHSCGTMFSIDGVSISQVRVGKAIYKAASLFNHSCRPNAHAYFLSRTLYLRITHGVAAGCQLELSYGPQVGLWDCKDRLNFLKDEYAFHCQCIGCSEVNVSDIVLNAFHCVNPNCSGAVLESRVHDCEQQKIKHFTITDLVEKNDDICEVSLNVFKQNGAHIHGQPGYCLKCGSYCDLESSHAAVSEALICIKRLQDAKSSKEISRITISDALISLQSLRLNLHAYNKLIAEAEDSIAQAFCLVRELQLSVDHCKASIQILEKLYDTDDIVIAYELVKLSSIQLSLDDSTAMESINRIDDIFSRYYGRHADLVFPYLQYLRGEIEKFSVKAIQ